jgi:phosphoribosylaminoimidazole-succinocarboxamide synthase
VKRASRARTGYTENFDKEFLRLWYAERGYRGDGQPPAMPDDFVAAVAQRYIAAYERLTGEAFVSGAQPAARRIAGSLAHLGRENVRDL